MATSVSEKIKAIKAGKTNPVAAKLAATKQAIADAEVAKARELLRGPKGDKGDKGDTGPQGPQGPRGEKGEKGDKPILGVDYVVYHGKDGQDGRQGTDGAVGPAGATGADGESGIVLEDATFTYTDGVVTRIDYADGQSKIFTYNLDSTVDTLVWDRLTSTITKEFSYNLDGTVASIDITIT